MILITGATGHLGNVLVRELINSGEKVRVFVLPGEPLKALEGMLVEVVVGNILDCNALKQAMQGIDQVYHLAGVIAIRPGMEEMMQQVNVEGARNVAEVALECGVKRLVHVSSVHAFRREPHGITIDEKTPLAIDSPNGSYDRTKAEGTMAVLDAVQKGLNAVIVCPTGIIGSHDYADSEMGRALLSFADRRVNLLIDGAFDFVDVHDVARGLILACAKGRCGEIYILSGQQETIESLHDMTRKAQGEKAYKVKVPVKLAIVAVSIIQYFTQWLKIRSHYTVYSLQTVIDNSVFSSQKAWNELGYRPRPLSEAIADFLVWSSSKKRAVQESLKLRSGKKRYRKTVIPQKQG
ncbi:MAG: NAD-dependent epimerase/dehydratase family protein [Bacillota bacterium]|nr:NAD-dependent epimerase/dehydratase family protein [Bacillota bacterium]